MPQHAIPAIWMRGGTSKGLFFQKAHLPANAEEHDALLLRAIGSPDVFGKQIDGVGGATSSTSKVVLLSPSCRDGVDVDYRFGHVPITGNHIDYSGNCGNLTTAVGVYAVEAGWVKAVNGMARVRIWQENIQKLLEVDVPVTQCGDVQIDGDYVMAGVPGSGARIAVHFLEPASDPSLFPTGQLQETLQVGNKQYDVTLINAGNPTVFVAAAQLGLHAIETPAQLDADSVLLNTIEAIRCRATLQMGLVERLQDAAARPATPKVALVAPAQRYTSTAGNGVDKKTISLCARIFSMGKAHHAFTGTGAVALGVAAAIPGTLVAEAVGKPTASTVIGHAAGVMDVAAEVKRNSDGWQVTRVTLGRTARTLMRGEVLVLKNTENG